jgi:hypothetical protein
MKMEAVVTSKFKYVSAKLQGVTTHKVFVLFTGIHSCNFTIYGNIILPLALCGRDVCSHTIGGRTKAETVPEQGVQRDIWT